MVRTPFCKLAPRLVAAGIWLLPATGFLLADEPVAGLITQLASPDRTIRREAALQLGKAGPAAKDAVPGLIKALSDEDKQVWSNAAGALAAIGPEAVEAIPALVLALDSRAGRGRERRQLILRAAYALTRIGPAAIPELIKALSSDDTGQRIGASKALAGMGPAAKDAIPALLLNLSNDDVLLRRETVDALGEIGPDAAKPLLDSLASDLPRRREAVVLALGRLAQKGAPVSPALLAMFKGESDPLVRAALFGVLPSLQAEPAVSVPLLMDGLKESVEAVRRSAINALLLMRSAQSALIPSLVASLKEPDAAVNERAADILARMGASAKSAVPELIETLVRRQPTSAIYVDAIAQIGPSAAPLIFQSLGADDPAAIPRERWDGILQSLKTMGGVVAPALGTALTDGKTSVRLIAAQALGQIGPLAAASVPALLKTCGDADPRLRSASLASIVAIHADSKMVIPRVETALHDSVPAVRLAALQLVPAFGESAKPLAASIIAGLKETDPALRQAAVEAIGESMPQAVPALLGILNDSALQPAILDALARIGSPAAPAAPRLFELLPNASKPLRLRILSSVSKTGAEGALAPAFFSALKENDAEIRAAALAAYPRVEHDSTACRIALLESFKDPELKPRLAAIEAVGTLGGREPETLAAINALVALLPKNEERPAAIAALKKLDVRNVPILLEILALSDSEVRIYACERLAAVGPKASEALKTLKELPQAQLSEEMRKAVKRAIQQIEGR
ncbi:MAG: repeat-containing protein [Chthoniobacteraceae bacterium]|nr:repeat-containing protein [Chthoniobacteraceae bacterium]